MRGSSGIGIIIDDAMIIAAALIGGCDTQYSEDMQEGLLIENQLRICNPLK